MHKIRVTKKQFRIFGTRISYWRFSPRFGLACWDIRLNGQAF